MRQREGSRQKVRKERLAAMALGLASAARGQRWAQLPELDRLLAAKHRKDARATSGGASADANARTCRGETKTNACDSSANSG